MPALLLAPPPLVRLQLQPRWLRTQPLLLAPPLRLQIQPRWLRTPPQLQLQPLPMRRSPQLLQPQLQPKQAKSLRGSGRDWKTWLIVLKTLLQQPRRLVDSLLNK